MLRIFQDISRSETQNGRRIRVLLSEEQFRTLVLHECARCDRNSHQFSLIQIDLRNETENKAAKGMIKKILKRIRTTDEAGWLSSTSLGVFLPETTREGARIFAKVVCDDLTHQIYSYPDLTTPGKDGDSRSDQDRSSRGPGPGFDSKQDNNYSENARPGERDAQEESTPMPRAAVTQEMEIVLDPKAFSVWKRTVDIIGSLTALILFSPLFLIITVYIKMVSRGPALYQQERIGYLGRPFTIYKFRTMRTDADCNVHKSHLKELIGRNKVLTKLDDKEDGRLIPLAKLIRKSCLDEFPQLLNVLRGEMSLVGPRPLLSYEVEEFTAWQRQRMHTLPGMTGLWQVSGKNRLTFNQMMRLDARYSRRHSLTMDFLIFMMTIPAIVGQLIGLGDGKAALQPARRSLSLVRSTLSNIVRQVFL